MGEGATQGGSAQVGTAEIGIHEGATNGSIGEGGMAEVHHFKPASAQVGTAQVSTAEIGIGEGGIFDGGMAEGGTSKGGTAEQGIGEVSTAQVDEYTWIRKPPVIPCQHALVKKHGDLTLNCHGLFSFSSHNVTFSLNVNMISAVRDARHSQVGFGIQRRSLRIHTSICVHPGRY